MKEARFRFYAELNDFLPPEQRAVEFAYPFDLRLPVKDAIEGLGVPHTEVDLILVNGESADFGRMLEDGDRVSVYPVFEALDIAPLVRVRPQPLREPRFVLDTHLGRLAGYLRMLGFDTLYGHGWPDDELARSSQTERRILLTQDRGVLKRRVVTHGYYVRERNPRRQLIEVVRRFDLVGAVAPLTRCIRCNAALEPAEVRTCPGCGRLYWRGSHYRRMLRFIEGVIEAARGSMPV